MAPFTEPESIYETPNHPQRRVRQLASPNLNSTLNVYDNLTIHDDTNRLSGIGALGAGFMNGSPDEDEDDEPEEKVNPFYSEKEKEASKHALLAANTRSLTPSPPPQYMASPRPGYAAPIEALSRPDPVAVPPNALRINTSNNPFAPPMDRSMTIPPQPITVPSTPHPLQPPITPITPVFARPRQQGLHFDEKPIMRGAGEGTSIPSRGEKGDDFWRRFSIVVKEENKKPSSLKTSLWLKTTQGRTKSMFRWVFFIGIILTLCAVGAIGLWWYASHNSTSHHQPSAIGGSAKEGGAATGGTLASTVGHATGTVSLATSLHVSPTNTVARRKAEPVPTAVAYHKKHLNRYH
ncbi:hypothetical protein D9757_003412 [Collybiopsis confluens]|uniref:Uncharacterized protein n=1 Tax=Collybiopsis confluens TaxID=2823264 RepID=A0A8H5HT87_9AGAR|nr:hypothetical protein D9757_003412 [Collybiopsis confluens]